MTPKEIKEYLGTMVEIEKECYTHERLLQALKKRMAPLGYSKRFAEPELKKPKFDFFENICGPACLRAIEGAFYAFILCVLCVLIFSSFKSHVSQVIISLGLDEILPSSIYGLLFLLILIFGGLGILIGIIIGIVDHNKQIKKNKSLYELDKRNYQLALANDRIRVQKEKKALAYIKNEYDAVLRSYNRLKDTRSKLYARNILFEKYRCFTAVSTLYEYFSAGRFTNLGDAYNQLELEVRLDRISLQLNVVISQLEKIKETQYVIYSAITESNEKLNSIIQSCSRIESGVQNLQLEGEELNSRIASLQVTSDLNLYVNAMNNLELKNISRWC